MADDKSKQDGRDSAKVNGSEAYEIQYFKEKLGVSASELKDAIKKLNTNSREKLIAYFKDKKH